MKISQTARNIRILFAIMAFVLLLAWGANTAFADEADSSLTIAPSGQIIVKDAQVTGVSGSMVFAETKWGVASIIFSVQTSGSTRFVPEIGSAHALASIRPGHRISFSGVLSGSISHPTVLATVLKDTELMQESASVVGTVESIDLGAQTFIITNANGGASVKIPTSALMSRDGDYADIRHIEIGDSAKATGTLDKTSGVLTASRVSLVSSKEPLPEAQEQKMGVLSSIVSWLRGSRGILSVRDR